jgi:hypothetical protein
MGPDLHAVAAAPRVRQDGGMPTDMSSRTTLQRVAVHIVARARQQATGRFSLRATPGGFGTPEFGPALRRVRVSGTVLVVESDAEGAPSSHAVEVNGATLQELAAAAGVDLSLPLDVGHDTPPLGDVDQPLAVEGDTARTIAGWYARVNVALDVVVTRLGGGASATPLRLWPEHFDLSIDVAAAPGIRVNLGGSPGDSFSAEPYLYVGPWTDDRPGEASFWNADFGATRAASELDSSDPVAGAVDFMLDGVSRLSGARSSG